MQHQTLHSLLAYILPHEESTEQKPDRGGEPPRSSELYPPEPPCWQDQWLSEITETKIFLVICIPARNGFKERKENGKK